MEPDARQANAIRLVGPLARFSLRLDPALAATLGIVAGFRLKMPINKCAAEGKHLSARLGPDEWLLLGPETQNETIAGVLEASLGGSFHSLVDIGHRSTAFSVNSAHARDILSGGCPLDLADQAFPAGSATRTILGKAEIVLIRRTAELAYQVECWRSFAPYVHAFLTEIAREFEDL
jgi:sarcosine oxidase subunit gamma